MTDARFVHVDSVPMPEGTYAEWIESRDGAKIRVLRFGGSGERGTALVIPGWAEPAEKYGEVALDLIDRGFDVTCIDPRGQGLSQRLTDDDPRGRIDDMSKHVDDVDAVVEHLGAERLTIVTHSMGGLVGLSWLARGGKAEAAMLSAPATRIYSSPVMRGVIRGACGALIALGMGDQPARGANNAMTFEGNTLTSDIGRHAILRDLLIADEGLALPRPTFHFVEAMHKAQAALQKPGVIDGIDVPVLIVSARADTWVDATHHDALAAHHPQKFELVKVEGALHELFMEQDQYRDQFWDAFDRFADRYVPKVAVSAEDDSANV
ncbi:MAG: alpha/beta hydrolase [Pseudomonadota bacterium]